MPRFLKTVGPIDGWCFAIWRGKSRFVAMAKRETDPFVTDDILREPGDVWFEFGETEEEALDAVRRSLIRDGI